MEEETEDETKEEFFFLWFGGGWTTTATTTTAMQISKSRTLRYINFGGATFEWIDTTSVMMI